MNAATAAAELIGASPAIDELRRQVDRFADAPHPVLVEGESGSGKELVARLLHGRSYRAERPCLKINCAALPADLLEAQLFGHARGAFTGAIHSREGFLGVAARGSLLLDEIAELPLELQSKLLRVLDDGEYYRLGETTPRRLQARVIAATNRPVHGLVQASRFRADLYYRLGVLRIRVPPLRERGEDVLRLFEHFSAAGAEAFRLSPAGRALLKRHLFPGNVRELRNLVVRLEAKGASGEISAAALEAELEPELAPTPSAAAPAACCRQAMLEGTFRLSQALGELERRCLLEAVQLATGNLSLAARLLGLPRTTLYGRLRHFSIPLFRVGPAEGAE